MTALKSMKYHSGEHLDELERSVSVLSFALPLSILWLCVFGQREHYKIEDQWYDFKNTGNFNWKDSDGISQWERKYSLGTLFSSQKSKVRKWGEACSDGPSTRPPLGTYIHVPQRRWDLLSTGRRAYSHHWTIQRDSLNICNHCLTLANTFKHWTFSKSVLKK